MFQSWLRRFAGRGAKKPLRNGRRRKTFTPLLERLEDRCVPTLTSVSVNPIVGVEGQTSTVTGTFNDNDPGQTASSFTVTITYGDGTAAQTSANVVAETGGAGFFDFTDNHTYAEESGSSAGFNFPVHVSVIEKTAPLSPVTADTTAAITDAALVPGNPLGGPTATPFTGVGGTAATTALNNFQAAIGGVNNLDTGAQANGFRRINWDGVKLDGADFGGDTTVITPNETVGIPLNRFQQRGVFFGAQYAVSGDGFTDVNSSVAGLFPAFTPKNTFAMFNDNGIDFSFVVPSGPNSTVVPAASRGFGAIFLNVTQPNTTSIEYFHGAQLLATQFVPTGGQSAAVFAGELFNSAIVTNVTLTLGNDVIFNFDGTTATPGPALDGVGGTNLVATDDFVYAEPQAIANGVGVISGNQGTSNAAIGFSAVPNVAFTGTVATFSDLDPNGNAKDYTAIINWGDGHSTQGTIKKNSNGGFDVSGTNTYASAGNFSVSTNIQDFGGAQLSVASTAGVNFATHNQRFLAKMYQDLLNRPIDPAGLLFYGSQLDAGTLTRQQVARQIESSQEYQIDEVNTAFQTFLKRPADGPGLSFFVPFLAGGGTVEQMKSMIMGSPEYLSNRGGGTASGALNAMFLDVLNRTPGANDLAFFNPQLSNNTPLNTIALEILTSQEGYQDLVSSYYPLYLRRTVDTAGLNFYVNALQTGARDEDVIAAIIGSTEYFGNVP